MAGFLRCLKRMSALCRSRSLTTGLLLVVAVLVQSCGQESTQKIEEIVSFQATISGNPKLVFDIKIFVDELLVDESTDANYNLDDFKRIRCEFPPETFHNEIVFGIRHT